MKVHGLQNKGKAFHKIPKELAPWGEQNATERGISFLEVPPYRPLPTAH